ncbi:MAG: MlaD family protein, partial [Fibrobacterota bacterium]
MPKSKYVVNQSIVRKHRSFFVGLFVLIPIILIPSLIAFTLYRVINTELIDGWCHLFAVYENTSGLTNGNPVTISGVTIGHVKAMKLEREKRILVHFKVRKQYTSLIRKDTKALLKQKNAFVGDWL